MIMGVPSSEVDLAFAMGLASQRFVQLAQGHLEVHTPQGRVVSPQRLRSSGRAGRTMHRQSPVPLTDLQLTPFSPAKLDSKRDASQLRAHARMWALAESRRAAREHAEAESERCAELGLRFEGGWLPVDQRRPPPVGYAGSPNDLWDDDLSDDDFDLIAECGPGYIVERLGRWLRATVRRCCGGRCQCLQAPPSRRKATADKALARYLQWKHGSSMSMMV